MFRSAAAVLFSVGCGGSNESRPPRLLIPSAETPAWQARVPLVVWLPGSWAGEPVLMFLDDREVTDGWGLVRKRWSHGGGADFVASLDLSGLSVGRYELRLRGSGGREFSESFEYAPPSGRLKVQVHDAAGGARTARVLVYDADLQPVDLHNAGEWDPSQRDDLGNTVFAANGEVELALPPGEYVVVAAGGIRDGIARRQVVVDGVSELVMVVPRLLDTPGQLTADFHVHTSRSSDAFIPTWDRVVSLAAADLDVAVISDHQRGVDPKPLMAMLELADAGPVLIAGAEIKITPTPPPSKKKKKAPPKSYGHVNAFPLLASSRPPRDGVRSFGEFTRRMREWNQKSGTGERLLLQINHPRGIQFDRTKSLRDVHAPFDQGALLTDVDFDEQSLSWLFSGTPVLDVDAMEVLNRFSLRGWQAVRQDWFGLMNNGHFITATGNSDSHSVHVELAGFPVNLVDMGDAPLDSQDALVDAVAGGRLVVTTGPLIDLRVQAQGPGALVRAENGRVHVEARVRAAPWVPVKHVRLVVDGDVVDTIDAEAAVAGGEARYAWTVETPNDAWIVVEAGHPLTSPSRVYQGDYALVAPGYVPIAFTNPVRVDADGDGVWTAHEAVVERVGSDSAPAAQL